MKKITGSISVVLALIITLMMSFCMVLIESARENVMLLKSDVVFDAGIKSLLAEYHKDLWEKYDLLYIDSSYGQGAPGYTNTMGHLKKYINKNLMFDKGKWLVLKHQKTSINDVCLATDCNGADFFEQAVLSIKEDVGVTYVDKVIEWLWQVEERELLEINLEKEKKAVSQRIEEENGKLVEVESEIWGLDKNGNQIIIKEAEFEEIDIENPLAKLLSANILLQQVISNSSQVSNTEIALTTLASKRELAAGSAQQDTSKQGLMEKVLFCNYLFQKFTAFRDVTLAEENCFQCELEYLLGGLNSDSKNMELVTAKLLLIREADNYLMLLKDSVKQMEAHAIAASAASIAPWMEPVVYQAILLFWAYEESVSDLQILYNGGKVPLIKSVTANSDFTATLNYEEYLMLLCMMTSIDDLCMRAMDLIELDIRKTENSFRMDGCISTATLVGEFIDTNDKKYIVTKKMQYY